ncbi:hypothetical protein Bealeia2_01923 (plasmid) [Candidatus Bealeia paramacronuclearis]|nr:hypothetical protein [Candidatus Bealeia paramacronuclearis]
MRNFSKIWLGLDKFVRAVSMILKLMSEIRKIALVCFDLTRSVSSCCFQRFQKF